VNNMQKLGEFQNCIVNKYETDKIYYEVIHCISHEILFAISISQAYKMARLLNLDWVLSNNFYNEREIDYNKI